MWDELINVFSSLADAYERIGAIEGKKREALTNADTATLKKISEEEAHVVDEVNQLETGRQKAIANIVGKSADIDQLTSMRETIERCPDEHRERLVGEVMRLRDAMMAASKMEECNATIAKTAIGFTNYHINRIGGAAVEPGYGDGGQEIVTHSKNFDFKA